jgi:hypothetical protein
MTSDNDSRTTTDPSFYPRIPDFPPPGEADVIVSRPRSKAKAGAVAGIVAAVAVAVGVGVAVTSGGSPAAQNTVASTGPAGGGAAGAPGGQPGAGGTGTQAGPGGGAPFGGRGGGQGGQIVIGKVTAVGATSITVQSTAATTTYTVGASTQIVVNGASGKLSDVTVGTTVLVQVPTTGSTTTATRIVVGGFGGRGQGGPAGRVPGGGGAAPNASAAPGTNT